MNYNHDIMGSIFKYFEKDWMANISYGLVDQLLIALGPVANIAYIFRAIYKQKVRNNTIRQTVFIKL